MSNYKIVHKVKLPKVAFHWMDLFADYDGKQRRDIFKFNLLSEIKENHSNKNTVGFLLYNGNIDIIDFVNAFQYGYELEETEEQKKIRKVTEKLNSLGLKVFDEQVKEIMKIVKGD